MIMNYQITKKNAFDKELLDEAFKIIKETESYEQPDKDIYKEIKLENLLNKKYKMLLMNLDMIGKL